LHTKDRSIFSRPLSAEGIEQFILDEQRAQGGSPTFASQAGREPESSGAR
jgi:hypothetical protein